MGSASLTILDLHHAEASDMRNEYGSNGWKKWIITGLVLVSGSLIGVGVHFGLRSASSDTTAIVQDSNDGTEETANVPTGTQSGTEINGQTSGSETPNTTAQGQNQGSQTGANPFKGLGIGGRDSKDVKIATADGTPPNSSSSATGQNKPPIVGQAGGTAQPATPGSTSSQAKPGNANLESRLIEKLTQVPVFTIANAEGKPLTAKIQDPKSKQTAVVVPIFMSPQDAQAFLEKNREKILQGENAGASGGKIGVYPLPLSKVYELQKEGQQQPEPVVFQFFAQQKQVEAAREILKAQGQSVDDFSGVPLFVGRTKSKQELMVVQSKDQSIIPFYFDKAQLDTLLNQARQQQSTEIPADQIEIGVLTLDTFAQRMLADGDSKLDLVFLIPTMESIQFVQNLQAQQR